MDKKRLLWKDFILKLMKDFRLSENEFSKLTGITQSAINRLKLGETIKPYPSTIKKIEDGLKIKIYDSEDSITYRKMSETFDYVFPIKDESAFYGVDKSNVLSYPVLGTIPAGLAEVKENNDWPEYEDLYYDPSNHFWLRVDNEFGYSMTPFINPGDLVLFQIKPKKIIDGDLVAVRWDKTKGALKLYKEKFIGNHKLIILSSYNAAEQPIILNEMEIEHIYKAILIKKK